MLKYLQADPQNHYKMNPGRPEGINPFKKNVDLEWKFGKNGILVGFLPGYRFSPDFKPKPVFIVFHTDSLIEQSVT